MKRMRRLTAVLLVSLAAVLSCLPDRSPTAPAVPPPDASLLGGLLQATGLLQCTPLPTPAPHRSAGRRAGRSRLGHPRLGFPRARLGRTGRSPAGRPPQR